MWGGQRTGAGAMAAPSSPLVSVEWLKENLKQPDVRVLDATWFLPNMGASRSVFLRVQLL